MWNMKLNMAQDEKKIPVRVKDRRSIIYTKSL